MRKKVVGLLPAGTAPPESIRQADRFVDLVLTDSAEQAHVELRNAEGQLDAVTELARDGMTMVCVTHEMGFARAVADRVIFMDRGQIVEQGAPQEFFANPQYERTQLFLSQILSH